MDKDSKLVIVLSSFVVVVIAGWAFSERKIFNRKYNSLREASYACQEWADKGGTYNLTYPAKTEKEYNWSKEAKFWPEKKFKLALRECEEESPTNQVLGLEVIGRKKDSNWHYKDPCKNSWCKRYGSNVKWKVRKNYFY